MNTLLNLEMKLPNKEEIKVINLISKINPINLNPNLNQSDSSILAAGNNVMKEKVQLNEKNEIEIEIKNNILNKISETTEKRILNSKKYDLNQNVLLNQPFHQLYN